MKLYSCHVRLHDSVANEVFKAPVTAAEIKILQAIHGPTAIVRINEIGEDDARTNESERDRLAFEYPVHRDGINSETTSLVSRLFGPEALPLPSEVAPDQVEGAPSKEPARPAAEKTAKALVKGKEAEMLA